MELHWQGGFKDGHSFLIVLKTVKSQDQGAQKFFS